MDAIVLAGSVNRTPLYPGNRPGCKALVELCGRPLIAYVLHALTGARQVERILVVSGQDVAALARAWARVECLPERGSLVDNAWAGLQAARTARVLFCNPDQPLLRSEMVDDFLDRAAGIDADLVTSWVRREDLGPYTEGSHKFARFGDGVFAHGNLFLTRRQFPDSLQIRQRLEALYRSRKSVLRFAWQFGPRPFLRFLWCVATGRLPSLSETVREAGAPFGIRIEAVVCPYPEIALDIDEPEDYAAARRYVAEGLVPHAKACAA